MLYLTAMTFIPLFGALIILAIPKTQETFIKYFAVVMSLPSLGISIFLWSTYGDTGGYHPYIDKFNWIPAIGVQYYMGVDGLSLPLVVLTTLLTTLSLWYSAKMIHTRVKEFFALFLLLEMGMLGVFVSLDLVLFYFFWEIGLVPMFLLIGIWGQPKDRPQYSAIKFFIYTLVGSVAMLLAFIALYLAAGSWDMTQIPALLAGTFLEDANPNNLAYVTAAFWAIFIAFAIKVPLWPFHTWLPDAHTAAPTAGSVILAGVLLKLGGYGMIRVLIPFFPHVFQNMALIIATLGLISMIYGALVSFAQWDLKRLIAYSSVSHMGYFILGLAAAMAFARDVPGVAESRVIALNGAVLQMVTHGLITGGLFFLVGVIYERTHTRDLKAFGGLSAKLPVYYGVMMVTGLASLGLPGLAGFISEFMVFRGAFHLIPNFALIGIIAIVLTAAYILYKIIQHVFLGEFNEDKWNSIFDAAHWPFKVDMAAFEVITMAPLLFGMIVIGIAPAFIINTINATSVLILQALR
ncbi:MAG: NADH-quinone oxidoreductase subunit M [Anaerolineae bacterium]|nr:NADH-quinone oxidoreductase subunit M [Anaerolineae bacterium]